ncbi:mast cell tryptase-like [Anopheles darlingi]|uniref:mast cell tryptase-like n=1 Tax=Anopheles darlingi TaxID=43151 RepID=UPI00210040F4|nr:mast cell tryptase-like [Anopheles darlingi]
MIASSSFSILIVVSMLITVNGGLSCTLGKCVKLKECSTWNQIFDRPYISKSELELFSDAIAACANSVGTELQDREMCCSREDIYKEDIGKQDIGQHRDIGTPKCVESKKTLDPDRRVSSKTSFGVFIYIHNQTNSSVKRCVGSLIDANLVLTSAHCVHEVASESITLYINAKYVHNGENGTVSLGVEPSYVESVITYEEYDPAQVYWDIALLLLKKEIEINAPDSPYPICIPTAEEHYESDNYILHSFGWGANAEGILTDIKLSVTLQRISLEQCVKEGVNSSHTDEFEKIIINSNDLICTLGISGHNLFEGYSGAPLMYRKNGAWFLLGVVGKPLNPEDKKGSIKPNRVISTFLPHHTGWIEDIIHGDQQDVQR